MTDDEALHQNVEDELRLADSALQAADALLGLGIVPDAASRAYYAAFHAARALLFSIGIEPRSHAGLRTMLSRHFVRTGKLAAERAKDLAQLEGLRAAGDYDSAFALGVDDVRPDVERARRFVADARRVCRGVS
ncbi:MAG: hypothetical protein A2138_08020 [Deltaproteobacteria bacterium RBG_16_71_12]|nr:MAG: hypothetical protein A2138_08020 [Deltaproteobacteria bacterium RBG_16_71_12]